MSSANPKNALQETFQRSDLPLPTYETKRVGGPSHLPIWKSTVKLFDGRTFEGDLESSKTGSEMSAAAKALFTLKPKTTSADSKLVLTTENALSDEKTLDQAPSLWLSRMTLQPYSSPYLSLASKFTKTLKGYVVLLIDYENIPELVRQSTQRLDVTNLSIYSFVGMHHHAADKDHGPNITKVISKSSRKDGVDSCIQVHVGAFLNDQTYDAYMIATRDHFGASLIDMISSDGMVWSKRPSEVVSTIEHVIDFLKRHCNDMFNRHEK